MLRGKIFALLLFVAALLWGCSVTTADQMYCLPKRSDDYNNVQSAIDKAMTGLSYSAPLSGENQQPVQIVDLNGDGVDEYLLYAKSSSNRPLRILVFQNTDGEYVLTDTLDSTGTSFEMVEYVQMDDKPGLEVVVGRQLNDQMIRTVSVYTMRGGNMEQVITVNYSKFLSVDLDNNGISELMLMRPGNTDTDNGVVTLYAINKDGTIERSNEVSMSRPVDKLKRIIVGKLHGGTSAVFIASTVEDTALITDVFAMRENMLANVSVSNESGTSIQTLRNYYIYADDIDNDGVVELPALLSMKPRGVANADDRHHLIRWYALTPEGEEVDKLYTFHNFVGGWYLQLPNELLPYMTVSTEGNQYEIYLWDSEYKNAEKLLTVYALSAQNKDEQSTEDGRFVVYRNDAMIYSAKLEEIASQYGLTQDDVIYRFRLIQQDWKTGET